MEFLIKVFFKFDKPQRIQIKSFKKLKFFKNYFYCYLFCYLNLYMTHLKIYFWLQVCTAKSANDFINYERMEILGDAFLKFAVSFFLFKNYSLQEGILTNLKGKLIGNRNLLYCGVKKNFPEYISVSCFLRDCFSHSFIVIIVWYFKIIGKWFFTPIRLESSSFCSA